MDSLSLFSAYIYYDFSIIKRVVTVKVCQEKGYKHIIYLLEEVKLMTLLKIIV